jgi:membrane associated rhomboid family serine protease
MNKKTKKLVRNFMVAVAIILIWRGVWIFLDLIDRFVFNGNHIWTALGGIIAGLLILYIPDRDLDELGKL